MTDHDPIGEMQTWLDEARAVVGEPHTMTLATATPDGRPSARVVLLRGIDARGLTFFTNRTSRKGDELRQNPRAAVAMHWWELGRQIRVEGTVEEISEAESAAYWETRPRGSQIAAWASPQSQPLSERAELDARVSETEERFDAGGCSASALLGRIPPPTTVASSSGPTATTDSTTGFATCARVTAGSESSWRPSYEGGASAPSVYRPSAFHSM